MLILSFGQGSLSGFMSDFHEILRSDSPLHNSNGNAIALVKMFVS